ncbi:MAG: hypothetical protein IPM47_01140 [Sphingobacteriales bacterium]|nr:MAG: hypothetical protein IPM47_01140 [Sphingobacteriales bacterium]
MGKIQHITGLAEKNIRTFQSEMNDKDNTPSTFPHHGVNAGIHTFPPFGIRKRQYGL